MPSTADLAKSRYSCRRFLNRPLEAADRRAVEGFLVSLSEGPFGNRCRFALVAATAQDSEALKGLGTYGFIRGATGFIVGAMRPAAKDMEDYGYCMEQSVLMATGLGLGTCWLGGTFTKSSFAHTIGAQQDEILPGVVALGYPAESSRRGWMRKGARSDSRLSPDRLFFDETFQTPLAIPENDGLADLLEIVRWAPSASNKQPWRLLHDSGDWHFYLERTPGYGRGRLSSLVRMADLQRVDMGIAMCHFELAAREAGLGGRWVVLPSTSAAPTVAEREYIASWLAD